MSDLQRVADVIPGQETGFAEGRYRKEGDCVVPISAAGLEVWPVLVHSGHGEETMLLGVYASREAAFRAVRDLPNMTAYVDDKGHLKGCPRRVTGRAPNRWAHGRPVKVGG